MNKGFDDQLQEIERATLTPLVQRALKSETAEPIDWEYDTLLGGAGDMGMGLQGVFRFRGTARIRDRDQDQKVPWSLILKVCGSSIGGDDPSGWDYWKRELLAFQSGLLDDLPGGLVAPRCFGTAEPSAEQYWLWLEDISDELGAQWSLDGHGLAARHLGQFNGTYLTERPTPVEPWLSQGWLRNLIAQAAPMMAQLQYHKKHPLIGRLLPGRTVDDILRLWAERETFLTALEHLPQTFCHRDAFRRNLFARRSEDGREQTVAIDWAFVGIGAIGAEIAPLVAGSLFFFEIDQAATQKLDETVFENYVEGLEEAGWHGDPSRVRLGYGATSALMYCIGYLEIESILDESRHAWLEQLIGRTIGEMVDTWADVYLFVLELAQEARELMALV